MPSLFKPTDEQIAVVDAVRAGDDLKIKAYAGAGKTSTLRLIAHHFFPTGAADIWPSTKKLLITRDIAFRQISVPELSTRSHTLRARNASLRARTCRRSHRTR